MARLESDHENLRAALSWSSRDRSYNDCALGIVGAIWRFWDMRGYSREGRQWLSLVLGTISAGAPSESRAKALNGAAELAFRYGDLAAAKPLYDECLNVWRRLGNRLGAASSLMGLGSI